MFQQLRVVIFCRFKRNQPPIVWEGVRQVDLFCWLKRNQPPIVWEGVRQVAFVLLVETRLTADCLRGVRPLASVVEPEQPPIAQFKNNFSKIKNQKSPTLLQISYPHKQNLLKITNFHLQYLVENTISD